MKSLLYIPKFLVKEFCRHFVLFKLPLVKSNISSLHTLSLAYHIGHRESPVPLTWFLHQYMLVSNKYCSLTFPKFTNCTHLVTLLILSSDVALNPGPVNFGFVNFRSVHNKHVAITDIILSQSIDIARLTETHIRGNDTSSFLRDFFVNNNFSCNVVSSPPLTPSNIWSSRLSG